jgi:hypothetical protein
LQLRGFSFADRRKVADPQPRLLCLRIVAAAVCSSDAYTFLDEAGRIPVRLQTDYICVTVCTSPARCPGIAVVGRGLSR